MLVFPTAFSLVRLCLLAASLGAGRLLYKETLASSLHSGTGRVTLRHATHMCRQLVKLAWWTGLFELTKS